MSYFMVMTNQGNWGTGDTLVDAKKNASYHPSDRALITVWDKQPEDWRIDHVGQLFWSEDATLVDQYYLDEPYGKRVEIPQKSSV